MGNQWCTQCPVCGWAVGVSEVGVLARHPDPNTGPFVKIDCPGSGRALVTDEALTQVRRS